VPIEAVVKTILGAHTGMLTLLCGVSWWDEYRLKQNTRRGTEPAISSEADICDGAVLVIWTNE
jgi:hypothetical protein